MNEHDVIAACIEDMRAKGINPDPYYTFTADGTRHRFHVEGDSQGTENGFAFIYGDSIPAAHYGSWKTMPSGTNWCSKRDNEMTTDERREYREVSEARKADRERQRIEDEAAAAVEARRVWSGASDETQEHAYAKRKCVNPDGLRMVPWTIKGENVDVLLVPMRNVAGEIVNLQRILSHKPQGWGKTDKLYMREAQRKGAFHVIGTLPTDGSVVYIAEGWATGKTVAQVTKAPVVLAFDTSCLLATAEAVRELCPESRIVFAADNDAFTFEPVVNPGIKYAEQAAKAVGNAEVIYPEFPGKNPQEWTDWNDMAVNYGDDAVRDQLGDDDDENGFEFETALEAISNFKKIEWAVKDYISKGSLTFLYGLSYAGKSHVAIDISTSVAAGIPWQGNDTTKGVVLYIAAEGRQGVKLRMMGNCIDKGISIENMPFGLSKNGAPLDVEDAAKEVARGMARLAQKFGEVPSMVVVDTFARNFGANENSAEDVMRFIRHLDKYIRDVWDAAVIVVHHCGKDTLKGMRGSTAMFSAADHAYLVTKDDKRIIYVTCTKMKDGSEPDAVPMSMDEIEIPSVLKDDGTPETTVVLRREEHAAPSSSKTLKPLTQPQRKAMEILNGLLSIEGNQAGVTRSHWRAEIIAVMKKGEDTPETQKYAGALTTACLKGYATEHKLSRLITSNQPTAI